MAHRVVIHQELSADNGLHAIQAGGDHKGGATEQNFTSFRSKTKFHVQESLHSGIVSARGRGQGQLDRLIGDPEPIHYGRVNQAVGGSCVHQCPERGWLELVAVKWVTCHKIEVPSQVTPIWFCYLDSEFLGSLPLLFLQEGNRGLDIVAQRCTLCRVDHFLDQRSEKQRLFQGGVRVVVR